jgi:membrane-associated phospholipid phosphatase
MLTSRLESMSAARRTLLAATLGLAAVAFLLAAGQIVCPLAACTAPAFDAAVLAWLNRWRAPVFDGGFAALTWGGSFLLAFPAAIALAFWQRRQQALRAAAFVPLALTAAALLSFFAKMAIDRPRPDLYPALIPLPSDSSFPSGHAIHATALALAWLVRPGARSSSGEFLIAGLLVALVALSRPYLQVHFPSDVLAGILAASLWVLALRCLPVWSERSR